MKLLAALVAALLVAGCGVRASGTIPGGPAPKVSAAGTPFFFVRDGKVSLVLRLGAVPSSPLDALKVLVAGPDSKERAAGLSTEIPWNVTPIAVDLRDSYTVSIRIADADLSDLAGEQLTCTAIANLRPGQSNVSSAVLLIGDQRRDSSCPVLTS
jgi:hypothetical protein